MHHSCFPGSIFSDNPIDFSSLKRQRNIFENNFCFWWCTCFCYEFLNICIFPCFFCNTHRSKIFLDDFKIFSLVFLHDRVSKIHILKCDVRNGDVIFFSIYSNGLKHLYKKIECTEVKFCISVGCFHTKNFRENPSSIAGVSSYKRYHTDRLRSLKYSIPNYALDSYLTNG